MRTFLVLTLLIVAVALTGCGKNDSNGARNSEATPAPEVQRKGKTEAYKTTVTEGKVRLISKHQCVRQIEGDAFVSMPIGQNFDEETKKAIESAFGGGQKEPVVLVQLDINIKEIIDALREQDPSLDGFKKDDFFGLIGKAKVTPTAPDGVVKVNGLDRFLRQDLIFQVSEDSTHMEVVIGSVSLAKMSLPQRRGAEQKGKRGAQDIARIPGHLKIEGNAQDAQVAVRSKLAQAGITIQWQEDGSALIIKGFPYRKELSGDYRIKIVKVEKGVFTASEDSTVPTAMMGMVYGVAGGAFMARCNAEDGTKTLADAVGNMWVFEEPGMSFNVFLPGSKKPAYALRSTRPEAMISFTKEGVLVEGFEFIVSPGGLEPEKKAK